MKEIMELLEKLNIDLEEKNCWQELVPEMSDEEVSEFKSILSGQLAQKSKLNLLQKTELAQLLEEWHKR